MTPFPIHCNVIYYNDPVPRWNTGLWAGPVSLQDLAILLLGADPA
jgi:hypothetical protein